MTPKKNVQDTHISSAQIRTLHDALISIFRAMNRPQRDQALIAQAGIALDRALFPLLVGIERIGPVGIVDLAEGTGRDYTTVSRQVAKLDSLGLVERQASGTDGRVRLAAVTAAGRAMTARIDNAREQIVRGIFAEWEPDDTAQLVRLMRKFADALDA
jgi:DNA-binding MarR family transcriptional regulator